MLVSSGAAVGNYTGWGAYGSSKAVLNHLATTLAAEEPDVVAVAVRPGVVDTAMQEEIRARHHVNMDPRQAQRFVDLKAQGGLLRPEQPGGVIADFAADPDRRLSGKFLR